MSISERVADAFEWVQLGLLGAFAGITFETAFGWVVGSCCRRFLGHLWPHRSRYEGRRLKVAPNFRSAAAV